MHSRPELVRYEAKYLIPPLLAPLIRDFIRPYCTPDKHGNGDPPVYTNTTLQLDGPDLYLLKAKELGAAERFKLRARVYSTAGNHTVLLEIKRKRDGCVVKSRARLKASDWGEQACRAAAASLRFGSEEERRAYADFVALIRQLQARPVVLLRYEREAYLGRREEYARVTFDRRLSYQPTRSWTSWGREGRWRRMDSGAAIRRPYPGIVLELKTSADVPPWMSELVRRFGLVRSGFSKYATAMALESRYRPELREAALCG